MSVQKTANEKKWVDIYKTTDFGNQYPLSDVISIYHHIIKPLIQPGSNRLLDFGCSMGAESAMFRDCGFDVWGVDISKEAIDYCINSRGFSRKKFICTSVLDDGFPKSFCDFDVIMAGNVLYYFGNTDLFKVLTMFSNILKPGGVFYASMVTYNHSFYSKYRAVVPDSEGLTLVNESGKASDPLYVNIVQNKKRMRELFGCFKEVKVCRSLLELEETVEVLHYIGIKQ